MPEFWDHRFRAGVTPWDAGRVPDALRDFAATYPSGQRALVPGCGSGWEVRFLADQGWDVVGLDFSAAAIEAARANVGSHADRLVQADYFEFDPGEAFDVIYERTFLCAMPRRLWPRYARRTADLLRPGGALAGYFYLADAPKGPPFGARPEELANTSGPVVHAGGRPRRGRFDRAVPWLRAMAGVEAHARLRRAGLAGQGAVARARAAEARPAPTPAAPRGGVPRLREFAPTPRRVARMAPLQQTPPPCLRSSSRSSSA